MDGLDIRVVNTDVEHVLRGIYHRHRQASAEPSIDLTGTPPAAAEFTNIDLPPQLYFQLDHAARIYDPRTVPGHTRFRWLKSLFMRVLRLYTTRQVEFNATVMRVLDVVADKLHDVVARLQYFRDAEVRLTHRLEHLEQAAGKLCERLDAHRTRIEDLEAYERELFDQRTRIERLEAYERGLYALRTRIENLEAYERELFAQRTRIEHLEAYERELFAQRTRIENLEAYEREILAQRTRFEAVEDTGRKMDKRVRVVEDLHNRLEYALAESAVLRRRFDGLMSRGAWGGGASSAPPATEPPAAVPAAAPVCNDHLYFPYLNLDRGTEEDIRARLEGYLPYYQKVPRGCPPGAVVLDVGCGRGEFLDKCRAANIPCRGLEPNEDMVAHCRAKQHDVVHANANAYLASLDDDSLRGIISCHVIEHMSAPDLLAFVRLTVAKVVPGGCILIETPNPNSVFALKMFYRDFSHVRPVHPDTLHFMYRQLGVHSAEVKLMSPAPQELLLKYCKQQCVDTALKQLNEFLFGYLDYALIVTK